VLADDGQPRYMIHESVVDSFLAKEEDREKAKEASLKDFAKAHESRISEGRGFVVVSESTSIADAKAKMERIPSCQDIFVTKKGESGEMLLGWVSNIRLAKKIQA